MIIIINIVPSLVVGSPAAFLPLLFSSLSVLLLPSLSSDLFPCCLSLYFSINWFQSTVVPLVSHYYYDYYWLSHDDYRYVSIALTLLSSLVQLLFTIKVLSYDSYYIHLYLTPAAKHRTAISFVFPFCLSVGYSGWSCCVLLSSVSLLSSLLLLSPYAVPMYQPAIFWILDIGSYLLLGPGVLSSFNLLPVSSAVAPLCVMLVQLWWVSRIWCLIIAIPVSDCCSQWIIVYPFILRCRSFNTCYFPGQAATPHYQGIPIVSVNVGGIRQIIQEWKRWLLFALVP